MSFCTDDECSNQPTNTVAYCNTNQKNPTCWSRKNNQSNYYVKVNKDKVECDDTPQKNYYTLVKDGNLSKCTHPKPSKNICNSQTDFNKAFWKALKYVDHKSNKKYGTAILISLFIHLIFVVWGVLLSFTVPKENRVAHTALAIFLGPIYVLAYYLNAF